MRKQPLQKLTRLLAILLLSVATATCSNLPNDAVYNTDSSREKTSAERISELLASADRSNEPEASQSRLKASALLLDNGQKIRARSVFDRVQKNALQASELSDYSIGNARFAQLDGNSAKVLALLAPLAENNQNFSAQQLVSMGQLRAWALQAEHRSLASARERIFIDTLISDDLSRQENREALWLSLNQLSQQELQQAASNEPASIVRGWLTLALVHSLYRNDIFKQRDQLAIWRNEWRGHPAATDLPMDLQNIQALDAEIPKRVTLLLPLSGNLAAAGTAIRDGFLASYYNANQAGGMQISVIDTAPYSAFSEAYSAALQTNPDTIVGPLRKPELAALRHLASADGPVVLALNYDDSEEATNFYQFGLAASDEAQQLATTLLTESPQRSMIIRPSGRWGERVANAFKTPWLEAGSQILDEVNYSKGDNLAALMKSALQVDKSELRRDRLQNLLGEKLEFIPRRRKDIDLFFLVARPAQARSIKPILAFHYAGDVPVYSTSQIFTGKVQRHRDRDLNGIVFTETPWLLNDTELRSSLANFSPVSSAYSRMQAFGVDAFQLTLRIAELSRAQGSSYAGVSGRLSLGEDHRVRRELDLAKFVAGRPRAWTPPTPLSAAPQPSNPAQPALDADQPSAVRDRPR